MSASCREGFSHLRTRVLGALSLINPLGDALVFVGLVGLPDRRHRALVARQQDVLPVHVSDHRRPRLHRRHDHAQRSRVGGTGDRGHGRARHRGVGRNAERDRVHLLRIRAGDHGAHQPPATAHGVQHVIAFVLLSIGVQITWNGLAILIGTLYL